MLTKAANMCFDSGKVRKLNFYNEGDLTHCNQKLEGFTLRRCWEECFVNSNYHARRKFIDEFNR